MISISRIARQLGEVALDPETSRLLVGRIVFMPRLETMKAQNKD